MSWLAVDGYGFDRAYFDTARVVTAQERPAAYPWAGDAGYFSRAVDQGVGRALWFMHAAGGPAVSAAVARFASSRHADLWSGVGLAATFAGGGDDTGLALLVREAGEHVRHLGQGAVFAAKARRHAGFVPEHSERATAVLSGLSVGRAAALADEAAPVGDAAPGPRYEHWRAAIRAALPVAVTGAG